MKKLILATILAGLAMQAHTQGFLDLKRYSVTRQFGTARSMGMGGAIGATGIDFSVSQVNPAALAQIRVSQASGTIGLNFTNNSGTYLDHNIQDSRFNFSIPNMGIVLSKVQTKMGKEKTTGLVSYSFGFGFNRVNDFNRTISIGGTNNKSSYLDYLAEQATKYVDWNSTANNFYPFYPEELALAANAIRHIDSNKYEANLPNVVTMNQNYRYQQGGRQTDWNISWGGNFSHRIYFGAAIGVPAIRYNSTETITEQSDDPNLSPDVSFEHTTTVNTSGTGFNGKVGLMFRANDWLRFGLAYHTPTSYTLTDQFSYTFMSRNFTNGQFVYTSGQLLSSDPGNFKYKFVTPGKMVLSTALVFKKTAMVAIDYEMVNYKEAQSPTSELIFVNNLVNSNFQSASNVRVGGEYNYLDYRFRAGYALYASPFNDAILSAVNNDNLALQVYSVGFGYQEPDGKLFFDAAVTYERFDDYYTPYLLETTNRPYFTSANKIGITRLLFTVGTKF